MANRYPNLSADVLLMVHQLFEFKKWPITSEGSAKISLYQRFCERLSIFNQDEQLLLVRLSQTFEKVPFDEYVDNILLAYLSIPTEVALKASKIIFMPLLEIKKEEKKNSKSKRKVKTKSASALHYFLRNYDYDWVDNSQKFYFFEDPQDLVIQFDNKSVLILIDDFIGSGNTAVDAIKSYWGQSNRLNANNTIVISMVCQARGVKEVLDKTGVPVFSNKIFKRGISDSFPIDSVESSLTIMKAMEQKVSSQIEKLEVSLGYLQSEALVCMTNRSPNNTFPVFWFETKTKMSPFPRARVFKHSQV